MEGQVTNNVRRHPRLSKMSLVESQTAIGKQSKVMGLLGGDSGQNGQIGLYLVWTDPGHLSSVLADLQRVTRVRTMVTVTVTVTMRFLVGVWVSVSRGIPLVMRPAVSSTTSVVMRKRSIVIIQGIVMGPMTAMAMVAMVAINGMSTGTRLIRVVCGRVGWIKRCNLLVNLDRFSTGKRGNLLFLLCSGLSPTRVSPEMSFVLFLHTSDLTGKQQDVLTIVDLGLLYKLSPRGWLNMTLFNQRPSKALGIRTRTIHNASQDATNPSLSQPTTLSVGQHCPKGKWHLSHVQSVDSTTESLAPGQYARTANDGCSDGGIVLGHPQTRPHAPTAECIAVCRSESLGIATFAIPHPLVAKAPD